MFSTEQQKIIYNAVKYYQMHRVPHNDAVYQECDEILNSLFDDVYTQRKEQQR
jgi:hypothetical protein